MAILDTICNLSKCSMMPTWHQLESSSTMPDQQDLTKKKNKIKFQVVLVFYRTILFMLGLHYVPGSHSSHGSQKRSSPWCFSHFCLCVQVLISLATFSQCLPRSVGGSRARYGLSWMVLRFPPACLVLLGPLTFCYVAIKFCYVYQVLQRFSTMKRGRWMFFEAMNAV